MSGDAKGVTSMAAQHAQSLQTKLKIAPTDGTSKFNTIRIPLIPVACWLLNDPAFDFDSSFVSPNFHGELGTLSGIVAANAECPAALFGHCDPAGDDTLNKTLGDRRAIAIYALLTRQADLWEDLYAHPAVGDTWGTKAIQRMLANLAGRSTDDHGDPVADPASTAYYAGPVNGSYGAATVAAVKAFQSDNKDSGLGVDGQAGHDTRHVLFSKYMDWLCTPGAPTPSAAGSDDSQGPPPPTAPAGPPVLMQPADFLGGVGAQPGDLPKMSLQSCGKFNPVILLTSAEMAGSDGTKESTRNDDDAPNRRVIMFFFPTGTKVDAAAWPCPKVKESNAACKAQFWPDGDSRRKNGAELRDYTITRDTMACRFYDRFARRSPCEGAPPKMLSVILRVIVDGAGTPIPPRPFKLTANGTTASDVPWNVDVTGTTDSGGYVRARVPPGTTTGTLVVQHTEDDGTVSDVWTVELDFQDLAAADTVQGAQDRLANLGLQPGGTDGTLDLGSQRAINRFRELQGLPIVAPPGPQDPTPAVSTMLDAETVKGLLALYQPEDEGPSDDPGGTTGGANA